MRSCASSNSNPPTFPSDTPSMHIRPADLVAWLRTRVTATGAHGLIVPLTDSLQAAVVARLCQQAVREAVLGALLPSEGEERTRAGALAQQLQLPVVDVESTSTALLADELAVHVERVRQRREPPPEAASRRLRCRRACGWPRCISSPTRSTA